METTMRRSRRQIIRRLAGLASLGLFPAMFYYFSPYLCVMGALEGTVTGSLLLFGLLFLSSLVVGRLFCAWVCPAGALLDLAATGRPKPVQRNPLHWIKYLLWSPWMLLLLVLFLRAPAGITWAHLFTNTAGFSVTSLPGQIMYLFVVAVFFLLSVIIGRRTGCQTLFWMAPFMILGRSLATSLQVPAYRLRADRSTCTFCKLCNRNCPMGITVSSLVKQQRPDHSDCILCGQRADNCPAFCLKLQWSAPQGKELSNE